MWGDLTEDYRGSQIAPQTRWSAVTLLNISSGVPGGLVNCTLRTSNSSSSSLQLLLPAPSTMSPASPLPPPLPPPAGSLDVECVAGSDGGLPQTFHLEAYESRSMVLRYNVTAAVPLFRLEPGLLGPARTPTLHLVLFSVNGKGRGPPAVLEDISLRSSERHTGESRSWYTAQQKSWHSQTGKSLVTWLLISVVPYELQAPEDFLKSRYNLLDMSAMHVAYYGLDSGFSACSG